MTGDKRKNGKLVWIILLNEDSRSLRKGSPVSHLAEVFIDHSVAGQIELYHRQPTSLSSLLPITDCNHFTAGI
ncbi:hypothetical protein EG832_16020 [bacterium]|nr:hypothetical protein [bacterium]